MQMFLHNGFEATDKELIFDAEESKHMVKVLRHKAGDQITMTNTRGLEAWGTITQANPKVELIQAMGVDRIVLASLLGSNERHPIGTLIRWENVLDLKGKLVVKKELDAAYKSLLQHLEV